MHITTQGASIFCSLLFLLPLISAHIIQKRFTPITMGRAAPFGAIAATTLTNTGATLITGDCGTCPGTSITGFPPGKCTLTTSADGALACNAEADCLTANNNARAAGPTTPLSSSNLGGLTLTPGVYTFPTAAVTLSGTLTLNGAGNSKGQFIFLIKTTFSTAAGAKIVLKSGAQCCNIYFVIGTSATIGADNVLNGNFLAYESIAVGSNTTIYGSLCALNGAITLIDDTITPCTTCTT